MNKYYNTIKEFQELVNSKLKSIFDKYNNEVLLSLNNLNVLNHPNNCIESSTSIGFLMEEFVITYLEKETLDTNFEIKRINTRKTIESSYDCYCVYKNIFIMINVKLEKNVNNAIAAINILHSDYLDENIDELVSSYTSDFKIEKAYLVLKVNYSIEQSRQPNYSNQNIIRVKDIYSFYLEEINFSKEGHKQDQRNWSSEFNKNSGRLEISKAYFNRNQMDVDKISFETTKKFLEEIYNSNKLANNKK